MQVLRCRAAASGHPHHTHPPLTTTQQAARHALTAPPPTHNVSNGSSAPQQPVSPTHSTDAHTPKRQPHHLHSQCEPPTSSSISIEGGSSPSLNGSDANERGSNARSSRKSSRQARTPQQQQQPQQQQAPVHWGLPLQAVWEAQSVLQLRGVCFQVRAMCLEQEQGGAQEPSSAVSPSEHQRGQQQSQQQHHQQQGQQQSQQQPPEQQPSPHLNWRASLWRTRAQQRQQQQHPPRHGCPPSAFITAVAAKLMELLREESSDEGALEGSSSQEGEGSEFWEDEAWKQRLAVRQVSQLLCRWVEGCVARGRSGGLQHGFAAGRVLLCLARCVQAAGNSSIVGNAPALLVSLLLNTPSTPDQAAQAETAAAEQVRAAIAEASTTPPTAQQHLKKGFTLAPHHLASIAWAAAVVGSQHLACPVPNTGSWRGRRKGLQTNTSIGSNSSIRRRGVGKAVRLQLDARAGSSKISSSRISSSVALPKRLHASLLGELLGWLYRHSQLTLGQLSTSQLVQLLWGMAKLRQASRPHRAGIVPQQHTLSSRQRSHLLVTKTRAAASNSTPNEAGGSTNGVSDRAGVTTDSTSDRAASPTKQSKQHTSSALPSIPSPHKQSKHTSPARLPRPPTSWWHALEAAVLLDPQQQQPWPSSTQQPSSLSAPSVAVPSRPSSSPSVSPVPLSPSSPPTSPVSVPQPSSPASASYNPSSSSSSSDSSPSSSNLKSSGSSPSNNGAGTHFPRPLLSHMSAAELSLCVWGMGGLARQRHPPSRQGLQQIQQLPVTQQQIQPQQPQQQAQQSQSQQQAQQSQQQPPQPKQQQPQQPQTHQSKPHHQQGPSPQLLHHALTCCCLWLEQQRPHTTLHTPTHTTLHTPSNTTRPTPPLHTANSLTHTARQQDPHSPGFTSEHAAMLLRGLAQLQYRPPPALLFHLMLGSAPPTLASAPTAVIPASAPAPTALSHPTAMLTPIAASTATATTSLPSSATPTAQSPPTESTLPLLRAPNSAALTATQKAAPTPALAPSPTASPLSSFSDDSSSSRHGRVSPWGSISDDFSSSKRVRVRAKRPSVAHQLQMMQSANLLMARPPASVLLSLEQDFKERLGVCSAAQLVSNARMLLKLGLHTPSGGLLLAWLEELHTKRKGLTPVQAVEVLQLLAQWKAFPGMPWLSDFLDTTAAVLPTYSRSRIVDYLEALVALGVTLDTSFIQPASRKASKQGARQGSGSSTTSRSSTTTSSHNSHSHSDNSNHTDSAAANLLPSHTRPLCAAAVLPKRAKWVRSVLRTFKSRRQATARVDHLDRLQTALGCLCTAELRAAVQADLEEVVAATAPAGYGKDS